MTQASERAPFERAAAAWRGAAILLLNTIVLLVVLELIAAGLLKVMPAPAAAAGENTLHAERVSWYTSRPWTPAFWREHRRATNQLRYEPYAIWRNAPFAGTWVNVGADGLRATPGSGCASGAARVFTFGGSAMWGWGSPDSATIPAHLQRLLSQNGVNACVTNFAQLGYITTQEVIAFERELQAGNVPDFAIFYDGFNDCLLANDDGRPGLHMWADSTAQRQFATLTPKHPVRDLVAGTHLYRLLARVARGKSASPRGPRPSIDTSRVAATTAALYLANVKLIGDVAQGFGVSYAIFLQPWVGASAKHLTAEERDGNRSPATALCTAAYRQIRDGTHSDAHVHDLTGVFDAVDSTVFTGAVHITPDGNGIVARRIAELLPQVKSKP